MSNLPYYAQRLGIEADADERAARRAYARELKLIDQEADPAAFQELREAYEAALYWLRHHAAEALDEERLAPSDAPGPQEQAAQAALATDESVVVVSEAVEPQGPDAWAIAGEVFAEFQQRCRTMADGAHEFDMWARELRTSLGDPRLIEIVVREAFEIHVAILLARGWLPGHEALFVAAIRVFEWDMDRRRVFALGEAGYMLDAAIGQRAVFDQQSDEECAQQGQVIARLRDPQAPSTRELLKLMPLLETVVARFPTWLAVITDTDNISRWRNLDAMVPAWRRVVTEWKLNAVWPAIIVFWILVKFLVSDGGIGTNAPAQRNQAQHHATQGITLLNSGDADASLSSFDRALKINPELSDAYGGRAMAHVALFDAVSARKDLDKLETLDRLDPRLPRGRGVLAYREGRYQEAIALLTRSLEIHSDSAFTYFHRGLTYEKNGQMVEALADADDAIRLDPDHFKAHLLRVRVFLSRGDHAKVRAQAAEVLIGNDKSAGAHITAASILMMIGDRKGAVEVLDRGIASAPNANIHLYRAALRAPSDVGGRRLDVASALELDPESAQGLAMRGEVELAAGQYAAAIEAFNAANEAYSTREMRPTLIAGRGIAHAKRGDPAAAENEFKMALTIANNSFKRNNLCWYLAVRNVGLSTALQACDAALADNPKFFAALDSKALVYIRMHRYQDAISAYDAALAIMPESVDSLYGRGIAKHRSGDVKGGRADVKAAIDSAAAYGNTTLAGAFDEMGLSL